MLFTLTLHLALLVCGLGLAWRVIGWFRLRVGRQARSTSAGGRAAAAVKGLALALTLRLPRLLKALVLDVLLQMRVLRNDRLRWAMHMLIFWGFMCLLLVHAMDDIFSYGLLPNYEPTLNPYRWIRNLGLLMVVVGLGLAVWRRVKLPAMRRTTKAMDWVTIVLLAGIMLTGLLAEATALISEPRYKEMVRDYGTVYDQETRDALAAFWAEHYGVEFARPLPVDDPDALALGQEFHEESCASCHSRPQSAFISYPLGRLLSPLAQGLARWRADQLFYTLHFLLSFAALAWLPWSKFRHVVTTPLSLAVNGVMDPAASAEARAARAGLDLDACTHCATCTEHCSVLAVREILGLDAILPSEKLAGMRTLELEPGGLSADQRRRLRLGNDICTRCHRCTDVCPAGMDLQALWNGLDEDLADAGAPSTYNRVMDQSTDQMTVMMDAAFTLEVSPQPPKPVGRGLYQNNDTFRYCFKCQTCTLSCPVVFSYDNPKDSLGLLPHQIMHSLGLGQVDMAMASRMTWLCLTCYQCQENCPQGVQVADILYELRNIAFAREHGELVEEDASCA